MKSFGEELKDVLKALNEIDRMLTKKVIELDFRVSALEKKANKE